MINKKELVRSRLSIVDKNSKVVPFTRNAVQRYFAAHKGNRNIILKSRQLGVSSEILADMFAESITIPNTPCAVVSHETRATQRLLDRVHFFYDTFPDPRPLIGAESRSELSFPGLNSSIYLGTAGSRAFGRGDTLRMAHLCLHPDCFVLLACGRMKKISDITSLSNPKRPESGDRTYSAKSGIPVSIIGKYISACQGTMIRATVIGNPSTPLIATPDHKVMANARGDWQPLERAKWIGTPIREVTTKRKFVWLGQKGGSRWEKCLCDRAVVFNYDFGWIIGLFLAEGSYRKSGVTYSLSLEETVFAGELKSFFNGYGFMATEHTVESVGFLEGREIRGRANNIQVNSASFQRLFIKMLGRDKVIPDWFWDCGKDFLAGVADGYIAGDGDKNGYVTSVRPWLLYQLRAIQLSLGRGYSGISWSNSRQSWTLYPLRGKSVKFRKVRGKPYVFAKIRKKEQFLHTGDMYDIKTRGSFLTPSGVVHNSELAFYDDPERILSGVQDAVPHSGELTIECTANGMDNLFYELWTKAKEKKSPYKPFFFPWWLGEDYRLAKGNPDVLEGDEGKLYYNEEEQGLVNKFHLVEDQIRWRRWKIAEKGGQFYQDFPEDEVTCFEQSGEPVFDPYLVQILARNCYDGERHAQGFHFWIPPQEKMLYVIGADSAAGVAGGSFSAAAVLDLNFNIVATFQGLLELTQFKDLLVQMGRWYNNAELAVERNTPGYAVLTGLLDYPNVYRQRDFLTGRITGKLGWWTSDATKSHMVTTFKDMLPRVKTWDMNLVRQMRGYQYIRYKAKAQASDDLLMATMIAVAVRKLSGGAAGYRGKIPGYSGGSWD